MLGEFGMTNDTEAATSILSKAEEMEPLERRREYIDVELRYFLKNPLYDEYAKLLARKDQRSPHWKIQKVKADIALTKTLYMISQGYESGPDRDKWNEVLWQDIFGEQDWSLVNCLGRKSSSEVEEQVVGAISVLTALDILHSARPEITDRMQLGQVIASPKEDVHGGVDLIFRDFGDTNPYFDDRKVVRLVQLKTSKGGNEPIGIWKVDPSNRSGEYRDYVNESSLGRMFQLAEEMERKSSDIDCQVFVMVVPGVKSSIVSNVFGTINKSDGEKKQRIRQFQRDAEVCGFLPSKDRG